MSQEHSSTEPSLESLSNEFFGHLEEFNHQRVTPAAETFVANLDRVRRIMGLMEASMDAQERRLGALAGDTPGAESQNSSEKEGRAAAKAEIAANFELARELLVVTLVTITETYLQDALTLLARADPSVMAKSEQTASYEEIASANSLDELAEELRSRWARNWIDRGGPSMWVERLRNMGASQIKERVAPILEELWGVRHVVVHRAGYATRDFIRRHPHFGAVLGQRIAIPAERPRSYMAAAISLVVSADVFFSGRTRTLLVSEEGDGE